MTTFSRNMQTGQLTELESLYDEQERFGEDRFGKWIAPHKGLLFANRCNLSPDGTNLYVATISDAVVVFVRDKESGKLAYVETIRNKEVEPERDPNWIPALDYCVDVCVSPDGKQVYVACQEKGAIVVFQRDAANQGKLKYLATLDAKSTPGCRLAGVSRVRTTRDGSFCCVSGERSSTSFGGRTSSDCPKIRRVPGNPHHRDLSLPWMRMPGARLEQCDGKPGFLRETRPHA